jgi:hypothetical protein
VVTKECFGQLANMKIVYNNSTRKHYLRVDEQKLKECDHCPLFTKCMFLRHTEIMKELLELVNAQAEANKPRI